MASGHSHCASTSHPSIGILILCWQILLVIYLDTILRIIYESGFVQKPSVWDDTSHILSLTTFTLVSMGNTANSHLVVKMFPPKNLIDLHFPSIPINTSSYFIVILLHMASTVKFPLVIFVATYPMKRMNKKHYFIIILLPNYLVFIIFFCINRHFQVKFSRWVVLFVHLI